MECESSTTHSHPRRPKNETKTQTKSLQSQQNVRERKKVLFFSLALMFFAVQNQELKNRVQNPEKTIQVKASSEMQQNLQDQLS